MNRTYDFLRLIQPITVSKCTDKMLITEAIYDHKQSTQILVMGPNTTEINYGPKPARWLEVPRLYNNAEQF